MLSLPLAVAQDLLDANFGDSLRALRSGRDARVVVKTFGSLHFLAASERGEGELFLRRELHVVRDLFRMRLGGAFFRSVSSSRPSRPQHLSISPF